MRSLQHNTVLIALVLWYVFQALDNHLCILDCMVLYQDPSFSNSPGCTTRNIYRLAEMHTQFLNFSPEEWRVNSKALSLRHLHAGISHQEHSERVF